MAAYEIMVTPITRLNGGLTVTRREQLQSAADCINAVVDYLLRECHFDVEDDAVETLMSAFDEVLADSAAERSTRIVDAVNANIRKARGNV